MRILGLDVGSVRIGVAVSDEDGIIASPLEHIDAKSGSPVPRIGTLCKELDAKTVVIGMPLSLSGGDRGESGRRAKALGKAITEKLGLEVIFIDERFTTGQADRALIEGKVRRDKRKKVVDKVAASLILQVYLDGAKSKT